MGTSKYLLIVEAGVCPFNGWFDIALLVDVAEISPWVREDIFLQVASQYVNQNILVIGEYSKELFTFGRQTEICIGVLLDENKRNVYVENGFCFHDWQELLDVLGSEMVQQMMRENKPVREILLAI